MVTRKWTAALALAVLGLILGLLLVVQLRTQYDDRRATGSEDWENLVADLIDSNARLRQEIELLETELATLDDAERGGTVLQSLVDEVNNLRIANGLIEVSGPGVQVIVSGPISVLDLHDLINELRNAGAEAIALNGRRLVAWSAISTDGERVTVDGTPVEAPYRLEAIGDASTLEVALNRPGGLVYLLQQAGASVSVSVEQLDKLTLSVYEQPLEFAYGEPMD
jgi:uncharacterized protein YlxW (UPF0749 family)